MSGSVMKMIDRETHLLQCRVCGHTHTAEPAPRYYRRPEYMQRFRWGTYRCWNGCTWEMWQAKKVAEARGREELVMHYAQRGCCVSEIARLVGCSTDFIKQTIRLGIGVKNAKNN